MIVDILAVLIAWFLCNAVAAWNSHTTTQDMATRMWKGQASTRDVMVAMLAFIVILLGLHWGINWLIDLM